jgi:hypothetical protein
MANSAVNPEFHEVGEAEYGDLYVVGRRRREG